MGFMCGNIIHSDGRRMQGSDKDTFGKYRYGCGYMGGWQDRAFRGTRTGVHSYGGTAYGEKGDAVLPFTGV